MQKIHGFVAISIISILGITNANAWDYTYHLSDPGLCNLTDYQVHVDIDACNANTQVDCKVSERHGPADTLNKGDCITFRIQLDEGEGVSDMSIDFNISVRDSSPGWILEQWIASVILSVSDNKEVDMRPGKNFNADFIIDMSHGDDHFHITVKPKKDPHPDPHHGAMCINDFVNAGKPCKAISCTTFDAVKACCPKYSCNTKKATDCNCMNCAVAK